MVKNASHTLAYSLIALQEMNLAFRFPTIFWNCACLISDSGGAEDDEVVDSENEEINCVKEIYYNDMIDFGADDDEEEEVDEDEEVEEKTKAKKKVKTTNYGKIASAIGKIKSTGVTVIPPDINESSFTFTPDAKNNRILFGLSGITRVGDDLIKEIIANRPYVNIEDLTEKVKINKPQVINLIKCGAFDNLYESREIAMRKYIESVSDTKKRITLQNMKMLIDFGLIPDEYDLQRRVYNFNKYIKKFKNGNYYDVDNIAFRFLSNNFDMDLLSPAETESGFHIKQTDWDKIYKNQMDIVRPYITEHNKELLDSVNEKLISELWDKYCLGSISKWEMDSVSCYFHNHELIDVDERRYGLSDFFNLPEQPRIARYIPIKGKRIPLFEIERIEGTVLDKDKAKKTVTILTKKGVVVVKVFGPVFSNYDKQISIKGSDGKKHVVEKSWFSRGNKIIVTGIRREDSFVAKKYSATPYHLIELINDVDEYGNLNIQSERFEVEE